MRAGGVRIGLAAPSNPVTICVLLYGDHYALCEQFFSRLFKHTNPELFELRIGLNAVCSQTQECVQKIALQHPATQLTESKSNLYKAPMMRRMLHEKRVQTEFTIWFDDDSYPARSDWLPNLALAVAASPGMDMFGQLAWLEADEPLLKFLQESRWFRGVPFQTHPENGRKGLTFITGGFWLIRTRWLYELEWPDPRIVHFEDDFIFGEALRQNGGRIKSFVSGVHVNAAERRAPPNTPSSY